VIAVTKFNVLTPRFLCYRGFVEERMGTKYVEGRSLEFAKSYEESSNNTPMFFILSPGVDPLKDVEKLGRTIGFTFDNNNFHNVSLGQGQEIVAENAMKLGAAEGHWVVLQVCFSCFTLYTFYLLLGYAVYKW
jgi:dynein heavy chain